MAGVIQVPSPGRSAQPATTPAKSVSAEQTSRSLARVRRRLRETCGPSSANSARGSVDHLSSLRPDGQGKLPWAWRRARFEVPPGQRRVVVGGAGRVSGSPRQRSPRRSRGRPSRSRSPVYRVSQSDSSAHTTAPPLGSVMSHPAARVASRPRRTRSPRCFGGVPRLRPPGSARALLSDVRAVSGRRLQPRLAKPSSRRTSGTVGRSHPDYGTPPRRRSGRARGRRGEGVCGDVRRWPRLPARCETRAQRRRGREALACTTRPPHPSSAQFGGDRVEGAVAGWTPAVGHRGQPRGDALVIDIPRPKP